MRKNWITRYLFAVTVIALAVALQWALKSVVSLAVFIILYPAVFLITWAVGFGPSLLAICISAISALSVFVYARELDLNDFIRVGIFTFGATLASWIVARGRQAERAVIEGLKREQQAQQERAILLRREQEARNQAEKAVQLRDEFIAIASHELKTPMTPLKIQAQAMSRRRRLGKPLEEKMFAAFLDMIDRQVDKLIKLVDDMLDISRISTGQLSMKMSDFNLSELVRSVAARMAQLHSKASDIRLEVQDGITCHGDLTRIDQLLTNLLSNAYKYGEGKPIEIKLGWSPDRRDRVLLSVRDQGIGISPEDRDRIFEKFERAVPATHISGLGIGLYLASQIAQAHQGAIHVESEKGRGSIFTLELPAR